MMLTEYDVGETLNTHATPPRPEAKLNGKLLFVTVAAVQGPFPSW
jgi:hypothetical protein